MAIEYYDKSGKVPYVLYAMYGDQQSIPEASHVLQS